MAQASGERRESASKCGVVQTSPSRWKQRKDGDERDCTHRQRASESSQAEQGARAYAALAGAPCLL
jgi:hypothetical protein